MRLIHQTSLFAVYDEALLPEQFAQARRFVQNEPFANVHAKGWRKVWHLGDGAPMSGKMYTTRESVLGTALDGVVRGIAEACDRHPELVGQRGEDWDEMRLQAYLYPRGAKLSWHNDSTYVGS